MIKPFLFKHRSAGDDFSYTAVREMAEKARFGGLFYLMGLLGSIAATPSIHFFEPLPLIFLFLFLLPLALREMAYRFTLSDTERSLNAGLRLIEISYLTNAGTWAAFVIYIFREVGQLDGALAATLIAAAGFTAGGLPAIVPHIQLIRIYILLMLVVPATTIPILLSGPERWYITALSIVYYLFLLRLGRILCVSYRQTEERNEALEQYARELEDARQQALAGSKAKSEFLAHMSHEIRTPMNGVIGIAQLLANTQLNAQQTHYLDIIRESGSTLLHIIDDILDFSKLEAHKLSLSPQTTDLRQLLENLTALFTLQLTGKPIRLICRISPELPAYLIIDPVRTRQVLYNLIGNAIKFTSEGEIVVDLRYTADVASPEQRGRMHVAVTDSGVGIPYELQDRVFQQFEQLGIPTATKGSGLGLSICKRLVTMMQGQIGFRSEPGIGSEFWFEVPVTVAGESSLPDTIEPLPQAHTSLAGTHVLVVEDDAVNQIVIENQLKSFDCTVVVVASGEAALNVVAKEKFDLILMDYNLPGLDGYATTREIRRWEQQQHRDSTPIIALTAHALSEVKQHCIEAGMNDYLTKPIITTELRHAIARWTAPARAG